MGFADSLTTYLLTKYHIDEGLAKKYYFILLIFSINLFSQSLNVSDDGRRLVKADGSAFIYLADTAWELFHRCDREEAATYLQDRHDKGFTVIQAVSWPSWTDRTRRILTASGRSSTTIPQNLNSFA